MEKVLDIINERIENKYLINRQFLYQYINNYIRSNHLNGYLKKIEFKVPDDLIIQHYPSGYSYFTKTLFIDNDVIMDSIKNDSYLKNKSKYDQNDMAYIYSIYLGYINHGLGYIRQIATTKKHFYKNEDIIICDSVDIHDKYYNFYLQNHNIFPTEQNANVLSLFRVSNDFRKGKIFKSKITLDYFNQYLCSKVIRSYDMSQNIIMCPTFEFYSQLNDEKRYNDICKSINMDEFKSLAYGLPISKETYNSINDVAKGEKTVDNIKELIK